MCIESTVPADTTTSPTTTTKPPPRQKLSAGGAAGAAPASLNLKSSADFAALAKDLGPKFKKAASSKDVAAFVGDLLTKGAKDPLAVEDLNELIKCKCVGLMG
jgi:hypothetical protein